jgi:hypothetical protein
LPRTKRSRPPMSRSSSPPRIGTRDLPRAE